MQVSITPIGSDMSRFRIEMTVQELPKWLETLQKLLETHNNDDVIISEFKCYGAEHVIWTVSLETDELPIFEKFFNKAN